MLPSASEGSADLRSPLVRWLLPLYTAGQLLLPAVSSPPWRPGAAGCLPSREPRGQRLGARAGGIQATALSEFERVGDWQLLHVSLGD